MRRLEQSLPGLDQVSKGLLGPNLILKTPAPPCVQLAEALDMGIFESRGGLEQALFL